MFLRGINYDVGTPFRKDELSRPEFDESAVKKEMEVIKNDLHCNAVRISGYDIQRLSKAAEFALQQGLQVYLSPAYIDAATEQALEYLTNCSMAAEKLRSHYKDIVFVVGCEYSLFLKGFIKGDTIYQRMETMFSPWGIILNILGLRNAVYRKLNRFLKEATIRIGLHFKGQLSYASGTWEKIDWSIFDIVGIDHYRASYNKAFYVKQLQGYYKFNKPVVNMEFGCCAYRGAEEKGPSGWAITEIVEGKRVIIGEYIRDENVQAKYITDLLDVYKQEKLLGVFVFTFSNPMYRYNDDPKLDLDMASYGIVKPIDDIQNGYNGLPWVPKDTFNKISDYYAGLKE
jgi:hypothetical protein